MPQGENAISAGRREALDRANLPLRKVGRQNMRTLTIALTMWAALSGASVTLAQTTSDAVSMSAIALRDACVANGQGADLECSCVAGFFGGRLQEDEFHMLGVINRYVDSAGNVPDMTGVQAALASARVRFGVSEARFAEIMARFTELQTDGFFADRICTALRDQSPMPLSNTPAPK
jgi:hypothetical protein